MLKRCFYILLLTVSACNSKIIPQRSLPSEVLWSAEGLKWEYFQDVLSIEGNSHSLARIRWDIYYKVADSSVIRNNSSGYEVSVFAVMLPSGSYVKTWANRKGLLEHEQLHFDIAEIGARRIRKEISETVFDIRTYKLEIAMIYQRHYTEVKKMNKEYDAEHRDRYWGRDYWRMKVGGELEELKRFSDVKVFISIVI